MPATLLRRFLLLMLILLMAALGVRAEQGADNAAPTPKDLQIYLLIGQSNMAGRAPFSEQQAGPIPRCYLLNSEDHWEPATNPLNRYSTIRKGLGMQKMNPGYGFALAMHDHDPKLTLGLVVNAKGGSRIEQWATDTKFYKEAIRRAKAAQKTGTLAGILWHQGESNNGKPQGYLDKLKQLVENLRKDLDAPDLPFVAGQIRADEPINLELAKLPKALPHTACVSSQGLKTMDRWHFDAPSMLELGKRYAEAIIKLQAKE